jgi:hypothetical protein
VRVEPGVFCTLLVFRLSIPADRDQTRGCEISVCAEHDLEPQNKITVVHSD